MGMKSSIKIFLICDKSILLYLRDSSNAISDPDKWDFPGTDIKESEDPLGAIISDLKLRFNLSLKNNPRLLGKIKNDFGVEHYIFFYRATHKEVESLKLMGYGQQAKFINVKDLNDVNLTPPVKKYLDFYGDYLKSIVTNKIPENMIDISRLGLYLDLSTSS